MQILSSVVDPNTYIQFGSGSRVMLSMLKERKEKKTSRNFFLQKIHFFNFKKIMSPEEMCSNLSLWTRLLTDKIVMDVYGGRSLYPGVYVLPGLPRPATRRSSHRAVLHKDRVKAPHLPHPGSLCAKKYWNYLSPPIKQFTWSFIQNQ